MTWFCQSCQKNNSDLLATCKGCQRPWKEVWVPPRRRRSQSAWRRNGNQPKEKKEKPAKAPKTAQEPLADFPFKDDLPWVATTPQSRLANRQISEAGSSGLLPVPPQPTVDPPPVARPQSAVALTATEAKQLSHIKALMEIGTELPPVLVQLQQELEQKQKSTQTTPISHGQLNRLSRLQTQVTSLIAKVTDMDQRWMAFLTGVMTKVRDHNQQYQTSRAELINSLRTKQEELKSLKETITTASTAMAQNQVESQVPEAPIEALGALQELASLQGQAAVSPNLIDDDFTDFEMEEGEEETPEAEPVIETTKVGPHTTFRGAPSPMKVANLSLKNKSEKTDKKGRAAR